MKLQKCVGFKNRNNLKQNRLQRDRADEFGKVQWSTSIYNVIYTGFDLKISKNVIYTGRYIYW